MNLQNYFFSINEKSVTIHSGHDDETQFDAPNFKAIVRADTNQTISIVEDSYKVVENFSLIDQVLHE